jgi:hypothetical protein
VTMDMDTSLKKGSTCTADNTTDWKAIIIGDEYLCEATHYQ